MKQNTATITVVCCNPEKMRDKLCCKGGKVIKSIEIKEPQKSKKENSKGSKTEIIEKLKEKNLVEKQSTEESPKCNDPKKTTPGQTSAPPGVCCRPCYEGYSWGPCNHGYGRPDPTSTPPTTAYPGGVCCGPCYEGYSGGPCYRGYGRHVPQPRCPCYDGYGYEYEYKYRYGYDYGENKSCCVSNCCSEENPEGCTVM